MSTQHIQIFPPPEADPDSEIEDVCLLAAFFLVSLLYLFDDQVAPEWHANLQYGTVVIAVMSCFRLALKAIIETCISQGAWIWVSSFRKGNAEARLEDFKMFDEAASGLHLACAGAAIMLLAQGFETFSSEMVTIERRPTPMVYQNTYTTFQVPPPPRAETWSNVAPRGTDVSLGISTRAAIYNGIIADTVPSIQPSCPSANCEWPHIPTLAVCGQCAQSNLAIACDQNGCTYTMPSGNSIVSVKDGVHISETIADWSEATFPPGTSADLDEFTFVDIPPEFNVHKDSIYTVPAASIQILKAFVDSLMLGNASSIAGEIIYSSDWIEAIHNAVSNNGVQHLKDWMARLSSSITNDIRQSGYSDPSKMLEYSGTAYATASHVRVNWYWVMYPLTLMVLAFLYLAQTVWRTARDQVCAWKDDSLPMLFCNVQQSIQARVGDGMETPDGLYYRVGHVEVELARQDDGQWLFRESTHC
ncbi:hypothetical protein GGR54DRAFT_632523 [Hypoxylon sp. NC1633]|nr:hypothetical protein GGR54DRAFT_632523 [Hypoxylon sp. NC1633]